MATRPTPTLNSQTFASREAFRFFRKFGAGSRNRLLGLRLGCIIRGTEEAGVSSAERSQSFFAPLLSDPVSGFPPPVFTGSVVGSVDLLGTSDRCFAVFPGVGLNPTVWNHRSEKLGCTRLDFPGRVVCRPLVIRSLSPPARKDDHE